MARYFAGGYNTDWSGTPLQAIYDGRSITGSSDLAGVAGQDLGHLLKLVLMKEKRRFDVKNKDKNATAYAWDGDL